VIVTIGPDHSCIVPRYR